jgi:hypothetical protein
MVGSGLIGQIRRSYFEQVRRDSRRQQASRFSLKLSRESPAGSIKNIPI